MSDLNHFCCPDHLTKYRRKLGGMYGNNLNGCLVMMARKLKVVFSSDEGWEHVSVSGFKKIPTYKQMDQIKREFWPDTACVMQLHVPISEHVNIHPNCLHLWRPIEVEIPRPP